MRFRENFTREGLHIANSDAIKIASEASVNNVRIREGREEEGTCARTCRSASLHGA